MTPDFKENPISQFPALRQQLGFFYLTPVEEGAKLRSKLVRLMQERILASHNVGIILDTTNQELTILPTIAKPSTNKNAA